VLASQPRPRPSLLAGSGKALRLFGVVTMAAVLSAEEYDELKKFLGVYASHYMDVDNKLPPHLRPLALLELLEKRQPKEAQFRLRQAINDVIEQTRHLNYEEVQKIDRELVKHRTITLSELRRRYLVRI